MELETASADDRAQQIAELLDRRRTVLARSALGEALKADPDHVELLFQAARADAIDDDGDAARRMLGRVLEKSPHHLGARLLLLALLTEANELVQAESLALELLREHPQWADLYAAYARVMLHALQVAKARELCREALRLSPENEEALRTMALCDIIERPQAANNPSLRKLLAQQPDDQHTLGIVVAALAHAGRPREALRGAQELLRLQPDDANWLSNVRQLRYATHWSLWPLRPLQHLGWGGAIGLWIGGIVLVRWIGRSDPQLAGIVGWAIFSYAVYSWVWPPLLRKILLRD